MHHCPEDEAQPHLNFRAPLGSEPQAMLRRFILALFVVALCAGFAAPGGGTSHVDYEQLSLQAPASDCGSEGMPAGACTVACHAGSCIAATFAQTHSAVQTASPSAWLSPPRSDRARAPDPAPPKHSRT
jgi:hypothetical protein